MSQSPARPEPKPFTARAEERHLTPLWTRLKGLVPAEPKPVGVAHRWAWEEVRPLVLESAGVISAREAERRVLVLENPGLTGTSQITSSVYAGIQLIMPGEVAPAHRHTQSALRFVLEGHGAYTAVDGEKTLMEPGDFVITPSWTWHHHGNEGTGPMIWVDGLDIPIVALFNATFREDHEAEEAAISRPVGDALARYGTGLLPVGYRSRSPSSPIFNYPWARTREALARLARAGDPDPHGGHLMRYVNPVDGGWAMPTLATMIRLLPRGFETRPYRSSDGTVLVVAEGSGEVRVGAERLPLRRGDVVVIPGWTRHTLHAAEDLVVFSYGDRVAQEKLGFFREERG